MSKGLQTALYKTPAASKAGVHISIQRLKCRIPSRSDAVVLPSEATFRSLHRGGEIYEGNSGQQHDICLFLLEVETLPNFVFGPFQDWIF